MKYTAIASIGGMRTANDVGCNCAAKPIFIDLDHFDKGIYLNFT
jgi:hypothetical protein